MNAPSRSKAWIRHLLGCGLGAWAALSAAGCSTLPTAPSDDPLAAAVTAAPPGSATTPPGGAATGTPAAAVPAAAQVEFRPLGGRPERRTVPLDRELYLQDVMQQTNAFRAFGRSKAELIRKTPTGNSHKMTVSFDRSRRKVDAQTDYHVRPGDILIVTEEPSDLMNNFLRGIGGPIGNQAARQNISG